MNKILLIMLIWVSMLITSCATEVKQPKETKSSSLIETLQERKLLIEQQLDLLNDP